MNDYDPDFSPKKSYHLVGGKAIILDKDRKILVLQRSDKTKGGGKWSLPGGAMEHNETPLDSIRREIMEETKLEVTDIKMFSLKSYSYKGDSVLIIGYVCGAESDEIILNWEHANYKWLTKDEALKLDLTQDGKYFLEQFK
ncbi:NUDIX domain-containing protein [Patescibacteria group bacterium]|nr:NUDIX domain-containing protein [Patescibacteria group bacterium]